ASEDAVTRGFAAHSFLACRETRLGTAHLALRYCTDHEASGCELGLDKLAGEGAGYRKNHARHSAAGKESVRSRDTIFAEQHTVERCGIPYSGGQHSSRDGQWRLVQCGIVGLLLAYDAAARTTSGSIALSTAADFHARARRMESHSTASEAFPSVPCGETLASHRQVASREVRNGLCPAALTSGIDSCLLDTRPKTLGDDSFVARPIHSGHGRGRRSSRCSGFAQQFIERLATFLPVKNSSSNRMRGGGERGLAINAGGFRAGGAARRGRHTRA